VWPPRRPSGPGWTAPRRPVRVGGVPAVGDVYENPRTGARMEVVETEPKLVVRRTLKPGQGRIMKHYHLDFVERFTVESGTATVKLGRETRTLEAGDEIAIPIKGAHMNPYNEGDADVVMLHAFEPPDAFAVAFVDTYGRLLTNDTVTRTGEMPLPVAFALQGETDGETYGYGPPRAFQKRVVAPLGAAYARRRGLV
jgi:quercetin dioxygenase-like cupin family protein